MFRGLGLRVATLIPYPCFEFEDSRIATGLLGCWFSNESRNFKADSRTHELEGEVVDLGFSSTGWVRPKNVLQTLW